MQLGRSNIERDVRRLLPFFVARMESIVLTTVETVVHLFVGRTDGPHVGLFSREIGGNTQFYLEAADYRNDVYLSTGMEDLEDGSTWLRIGYQGYPGIELEDADGYPVKQLRVDPDTFSRLLVANDLDLSDIRNELTLLRVDTLDNAGDPDAGVLVWVTPSTAPEGPIYLSHGSGDFELLIGNGEIAGHAHADDLTGGQLDHGLAMTVPSLLDDDHPQYLKEKDEGGLASEIPLHDHTSDDEAGTLDVISSAELAVELAVTEPQYLFDDDGNLLFGDSATEYLTTGIVDDAETTLLDGLTDVNASSPSDGQVLTWDDTASTWQAIFSRIRILSSDPASPQSGDIWVNTNSVPIVAAGPLFPGLPWIPSGTPGITAGTIFPGLPWIPSAVTYHRAFRVQIGSTTYGVDLAEV